LKELRETGEEIKITNSVDLKRPEKGEKIATRERKKNCNGRRKNKLQTESTLREMGRT
jgi:hypothetical protein